MLAYRTAHSGIYSAAFGPGTRELYHTIHPHPALSPVPTDDIASAEQLENEAAWRQLLIQGVLALILPPEHLENPCLRVLVGEIFSELILGNGICGKACEGWLIWELITKSIQVARFKGEDPLRVVEALPVNRLERFGLLSSEKTARAAAGPRMGARGPVAFAFGIFSAVIYYATLVVFASRTLASAWIKSASLPLRAEASSQTEASPSEDADSSNVLVDSSPTGKWPILDMSIWSVCSHLLSLDYRMPWLTSYLALLQWQVVYGLGKVGYTNGRLDR